MIRAYLDTNVLIDWLVEESRPNREASLSIAQAVLDGKIEGFISTQSLVDAAYIAQRSGCPFQRFEQLFRKMLRHLNLGGFNYSTIMDALNQFSGDFEDDAQLYYADELFCRMFVTGDLEMIRRHAVSDMELLTPPDFIAKLKGYRFQ